MSDPVLFGATYSVYTRVARLALHEKGVAHRFEEVDIFDPAGPPASYLGRQPFARIPALEHDGFTLYETVAIAQYVDEAFPGPRRKSTFQRLPTGCRFVNSTVPSSRSRVQTTLAPRVRGRGTTSEAGLADPARSNFETASHPLPSRGALVYSTVPSARLCFQTLA